MFSSLRESGARRGRELVPLEPLDGDRRVIEGGIDNDSSDRAGLQSAALPRGQFAVIQRSTLRRQGD
jgi:hypothetical protein